MGTYEQATGGECNADTAQNKRAAHLRLSILIWAAEAANAPRRSETHIGVGVDLPRCLQATCACRQGQKTHTCTYTSEISAVRVGWAGKSSNCKSVVTTLQSSQGAVWYVCTCTYGSRDMHALRRAALSTNQVVSSRKLVPCVPVPC